MKVKIITMPSDNVNTYTKLEGYINKTLEEIKNYYIINIIKTPNYIMVFYKE